MKPSSHHRTTPWRGLAAIAALALIAPLAAAGGTPEAATEEDNPPLSGAPAAGTPAAAGLVVFVDPATGEITNEPSQAQVEALSSALKSSLARTDSGLETFDLAGGGRGVHLAGRFHAATVVRQRPDGTLILECVDHPEVAAAAIDEPAGDELAAGERRWEEK